MKIFLICTILIWLWLSLNTFIIAYFKIETEKSITSFILTFLIALLPFSTIGIYKKTNIGGFTGFLSFYLLQYIFIRIERDYFVEPNEIVNMLNEKNSFENKPSYKLLLRIPLTKWRLQYFR